MASQIFYAMKAILASVFEEMGAGSFVQEVIREVIAPLLRAELKEKRDSEKQSLLTEYLKALDSNLFDKTFATVLEDKKRKYPDISFSDFVEIADKTIYDLVKKGKLKQYVKSGLFNIGDGVDGLNRLWAAFIRQKVIEILYGVVQEMRRFKQFVPEKETQEEMIDREMFEHNLEKGNWDDAILDELTSYVHQKTSNEDVKNLYDLWLEKMKTEGLDKHLTQSTFKDFMATHDIGYGTVIRLFNKVRQLVAKFFEQELDYELPVSIREKMKEASLNIVLGYEFYRRRIVAWMLSRE